MVADYYAMLGADPRADRAELEAALARRQPAWSSGTRNPKTKHTFQSYLDQIPEIRRVLLGDPAARAAYDAELAAAQRVERDRRLDELQRLIKLRAAKGGLGVADRTLLREQAERLGLASSDLDRLIEPIPPRPEPPADLEIAEPPPDVLDPVTRRQIRVALDHLARRDLYDALGIARDAPSAEVTARTDAERRRWMQKTQVTAEKTAWLEVVSHAQSHLIPPLARARYDRTLTLEAEEALGEAVAFAVRGLPRLDPGTRNVLIAEASALGIEPGRAEVLIGRGCRALGVVRDAPPALILGSIEIPRYLRCRNCTGVTEFAEVSGPGKPPECRHCRASLQWSCPACRRVRWVDEQRCACGFPLASREPLLRHFDEAQQALRARDYGRAEAELRAVQGYAPTHSGARKGIETIRRLRLEADEARAACEAARARRHLVAAREALLAWARLVDLASADYVAARDEVARGLKMAQAIAARARAIEAEDPRAARVLFEKALGIASDLDEARQGLNRCPPEAPTGLVAELDGDRVRLRWLAPASDGLAAPRFRVIRKRGATPTSPVDGTVIAEVSESECDDRKVRPGDAFGYAVYATRGETTSQAGATSGPIEILPSVLDLRAEGRSGEIALSWTLPPRAVGAKVVRNLTRRPDHDRDGDAVAALAEAAIDRGLVDDQVYYYGVFAVYPGLDGVERTSKGVAVAAVPQAPAAPLGPPTLEPGIDGRVRLTWPPPDRGSVRVIRTTRPLPLPPGDRVPAASTTAWEGPWLEPVADGVAEDLAPPPIGVCYYTLVSAWSGTATIGHPSRYSCVADPSDLRAVRAGGGGRVHLRWKWSPQGTESRVVARAGVPPRGPDDPEAIVASVSDAEYSRLGFFGLTLPTGVPGPWHLAVFSVASVQGERVVSPGLEPTARTSIPGPNPEVTVSYQFRRPGFPGRPWSLVFQTEPAGSPIPPTALVAHPRTVPLSPDDGEILARFPEARDGQSFPIPPLVDLARQRARVFADPRADPDGMPPIRLRHPENGAARV